MRRIWFLVITAVLVMSLGGLGATMAYFSASANNLDNQFVAGELILDADRDQGDTVPGPMFYTTAEEGKTTEGENGIYPTGYWKPGDSYTRVLQIENTGSIDGQLKSIKAALSGNVDLAKKLQVTIASDVDGTDVVAAGTLEDFIGSGKAFAIPQDIAVGDIVSLWFTVSFPNGTPEEDNPFQGKNLKANFSVYAEQN